MATGPQVCSICTSENRAAIEAALKAKVRYLDIAKQFGTSPSALTRHKYHTAAPGEPVGTPASIFDAVDAAIAELRGLQRRGRRHKDKGKGAQLVLQASRELRQWFGMRDQLMRRLPAMPVEPGTHEPEVGDDELKRLAEVYLKRHGGKS